MAYHIIFQALINGEWIDCHREPNPPKGCLNPTNDWLTDQCAVIAQREGKPVRPMIEYWGR